MVFMAEHEHSHERSGLPKELDAKRAESRRMLTAFIRVAAMIYHMGGEVSSEWPSNASGWSLLELIALIEQFALIEALCDGCAFGLVSKDNLPMLKPGANTFSKQPPHSANKIQQTGPKSHKHDRHIQQTPRTHSANSQATVTNRNATFRKQLTRH